MRKHIRGNLKTEELAPSCIRITNNSADFSQTYIDVPSQTYIDELEQNTIPR